ncbi:MAG: hypothetical protein LQ338_004844 [Usnochroma carphineum]|nr:MAG: hypothetical protein LQ338_004844 [Usnochroma carphineum]
MRGIVQPDRQEKEIKDALRSIIAGSTAGAVEIAITYPAEFAKTRTQLNRRLPDGQKLGWPPFGRAWYAGCTTLIIGNSLKAGIRFVSFDTYKTLLQDEMGKISGPRTVMAGFGAGITESLLAVTPFESIKTTLIDDRKSANPRMRGFLHGSSIIWRERGIRGLFQGFVPTTARQAANSATRFGSYTTIKQFAQGYVAPGEKLGALSTFGIGGLAGLITVYVTQPLDTIKTRMQSIDAKREYKNSFACAARIFKDEGIFTFWSGAVPRLARLILSGGIVFTMYEKTMEGLDTIDPERNLRDIFRLIFKYSALYLILFISVVLYLYIPKSTPMMAWLSSGSSNAALIHNLKSHKLITTERVVNAMLAVDRAHYSPALPYQDSPQLIGFGATISAPHMHASAAESLLPYLHPSARVLDIGSGSGYLTHVLANLVGPEGRVIGIDHIQGLVDLANANMAKSEEGREMLRSGKVRFIKGDGREGYREGGPYDAIHVGAAAREEHRALVEQLKAPGRMFIPVGTGSQWIWVVDKDTEGKVRREKAFGVRYVPLTDAPKE